MCWHRLWLIGLMVVCLWHAAVPSLDAQSLLAPLEDDLPPALAWDELERDTPQNESREGTLVESAAVPVRPPLGGPGGGMGGGPMGGLGGGSPFSAYAFIQPSSRLHNQSDTLQVRAEGVVFGLPVSIGPNGIWLVNTRVEHNAFETNATLPGSTQQFPEELWNINLGLMHIHPLDNGWTAGGMVGIGSASDRPFASIREMNANMLAFLNIPTRERDAWNFSLFYSPLGQLAFPVPGVSYAWRPSERFQMNIGVPFSLNYRPTDTISIGLSYLPLTNANAKVSWTPTELWSVYGAYQTHSQGYELANRVETRERFFDFDQRLVLGLRRSLGAGFALDGSAAYLFDRSYFVSDSFFSDDAERLRVDPGAQLTLKLEWAR